MQQMSSKDERLLHASEIFDGESKNLSDDDFALLASDDVQKHVKHWALVGSTLRNELPEKFDFNFADKVMSRINAESEQEIELPSSLVSREAFAEVLKSGNEEFDQAQLQEEQKSSLNRPVATLKLSKARSLATYAAQIAVAASVAVVSIIGIQTYNASEPTLEQPASTFATNNTAIGGLSLASYQSSDNVLNIDPSLYNNANVNGNRDPEYQAEINRQKKEELDRINMYVQGYVFDTASVNNK